MYTQALAKKIMFETNKTATGVSVETAGMLYNLTATKEVIVSAGAVRMLEHVTQSQAYADLHPLFQFQSPQMLMVSGIGSKDVLEKYGINVVVERPGVGQNMWVSKGHCTWLRLTHLLIILRITRCLVSQ